MKPFLSALLTFLLVLSLQTLSFDNVFSAIPQVYSDGEQTEDARIGKVKMLGGNFPFVPPQSKEDWEKRRDYLKTQILLANGLWPIPEKTDLKPIVHHPVKRDGYTVFGVILEVLPGFYATGSLYIPDNIQGKVPGVLSPHGHWANGRFYEQPVKDFEKDLEQGAEKYTPSGQFPIQARCATLAKMGCVVFLYDMIGYADSVQLTHRPGFREEMNAKENWGFFSPQAELNLQNMMGLQTLTSLRILDWFATRPEVDPNRIAITGASGGGTQSFILSAIDDRIAVEFPAVMVSTEMQGGCTCENAPYLRINTGNVEFAATFVPKPLGMTAAADWTVRMEKRGFPQLKEIYTLYDAPENVALFPHLEFGHNYNFVSRKDMYGFMNKHLGLGCVPQGENDEFEVAFEPLTKEEGTVWFGDHPKPDGNQVGDVFERKLVREMTESSKKQMESLRPKKGDAESFKKFKDVVGKAVEIMIGRTLSDIPTEKMHVIGAEPEIGDFGSFIRTRFVNNAFKEEVPVLVLLPKNGLPEKPTLVIFVTPNGKQDCWDTNGQLIPAVQEQLDAGKVVLAVDLLGQGESTRDGKVLETAEIFGYDKGQEPWQRALAYTYGYNHPLFAKRVHDILSVVAGIMDYTDSVGVKDYVIELVGYKGAGTYAAAARAVSGDAIKECVIDTNGFRFFEAVEDLNNAQMLPGIVKYGDFPALIALSAPYKTVVLGEQGSTPELVQAAFESLGATQNLTVK
ncbi:MAG: alpha/beta hydrolase family protein [Thermoguttaceae bacterium]